MEPTDKCRAQQLDDVMEKNSWIQLYKNEICIHCRNVSTPINNPSVYSIYTSKHTPLTNNLISKFTPISTNQYRIEYTYQTNIQNLVDFILESITGKWYCEYFRTTSETWDNIDSWIMFYFENADDLTLFALGT